MDIEKSFRHSEKLSPTTLQSIKDCEQMFVDIAEDMDKLPGSRERSLCLTKLQEAKFWAIECLAKVLG